MAFIPDEPSSTAVLSRKSTFIPDEPDDFKPTSSFIPDDSPAQPKKKGVLENYIRGKYAEQVREIASKLPDNIFPTITPPIPGAEGIRKKEQEFQKQIVGALAGSVVDPTTPLLVALPGGVPLKMAGGAAILGGAEALRQAPLETRLKRIGSQMAIGAAMGIPLGRIVGNVRTALKGKAPVIKYNIDPMKTYAPESVWLQPEKVSVGEAQSAYKEGLTQIAKEAEAEATKTGAKFKHISDKQILAAYENALGRKLMPQDLPVEKFPQLREPAIPLGEPVSPLDIRPNPIGKTLFPEVQPKKVVNLGGVEGSKAPELPVLKKQFKGRILTQDEIARERYYETQGLNKKLGTAFQLAKGKKNQGGFVYIPEETPADIKETGAKILGGQVVKLRPEIEKRAIQETSVQLKENPFVVSRVVDSVKKSATNIVEYFQNSQERVRQLVTRKDIRINDISDPYLKATLYPGKIQDKITRAQSSVKNIIFDMKKTANESRLPLDTVRKQVNDYLKFRHAPERNAALGEGASGITSEQALSGLKTIESLPYSNKIKELAERAAQINRETLDLLKDSEVISSELYSTLREKYKNHVPFNRIFEESEDVGDVLSGRGFDVRSTGLKRAVGSQREIDDIFRNIATNYEQAVLRSEKNIVDQSTYAFVKTNKDILGDLFEITMPKAIGKTFDERVILEKTTDPQILQFYKKGKPVWIKIKDPALAVALRGVGREKLGPFLNAIGSFTRLYSGLATRFNPEFPLSNKVRDLQETAVYLSAQKGIGFKGAAKTMASDPQSVKDVLDSLRGVDTEGVRLYNEMKSLGGTTGGFALSTKKQTVLNLKHLEKLANSKTYKIADNLIEYIDNWNTIFEDSTRLSVYKEALSSGFSKDRAAFHAKEGSINFNKMGRGGPVINSIWMFSNASMQGTEKMVRSLRNPKVLGAVVLTVGGAVATMNEWNDKVDPQWRDKVSKWDRLNNLPIMIPSLSGSTKYITIPVSWGLKPIKVMADYAYDAVSGHGMNTKNMVNDSMTALIEAYNPLGGSDLVSALTPTILDTPVDIARNRSWTGAKIRPDYDPNAPEDIKYFRSLRETQTGQTMVSISELLQDKASVSVSPANMKYAFESYIGGAGKSVSRLINSITGGVSGKPVPLDEYPFIARFYREREKEELGVASNRSIKEIKDILSSQKRNSFKIRNDAESLHERLKTMPNDQANRVAQKVKKQNPAVYMKLKDVKEEDELGLTRSDKLIKDFGVENHERAKFIFEEIKKIPPEEQASYRNDLRKKKILTEKVEEQLNSLILASGKGR